MALEQAKRILERRGFSVAISDNRLVFSPAGNDTDPDLTACIASEEDDTSALGTLLQEMGFDIHVDDNTLYAESRC